MSIIQKVTENSCLQPGCSPIKSEVHINVSEPSEEAQEDWLQSLGVIAEWIFGTEIQTDKISWAVLKTEDRRFVPSASLLLLLQWRVISFDGFITPFFWTTKDLDAAKKCCFQSGLDGRLTNSWFTKKLVIFFDSDFCCSGALEFPEGDGNEGGRIRYPYPLQYVKATISSNKFDRKTLFVCSRPVSDVSEMNLLSFSLAPFRYVTKNLSTDLSWRK